MVIVEYCRFGNLQTFLINNRDKFINQLDELGNMKSSDSADNTSISYFADVERKHSELGKSANTREEEDYIEDPKAFWKYGQDPEAININPTISTRDLISWSFQIARGMAYLASRKVSII